MTRRATDSLAQKRFQEAEALAQELCRLIPGNPLAWQLLGRAYEGQGRKAEARKVLEEAERLSR